MTKKKTCNYKNENLKIKFIKRYHLKYVSMLNKDISFSLIKFFMTGLVFHNILLFYFSVGQRGGNSLGLCSTCVGM